MVLFDLDGTLYVNGGPGTSTLLATAGAASCSARAGSQAAVVPPCLNVTTFSGPRRTAAVVSCLRPQYHTAVSSLAATFFSHCDFSRTVDTTTLSPRRSPRSGTSRRSPEILPVASTTTTPSPSGNGDPRPAFTSGITTRFNDRNNRFVGSTRSARSLRGSIMTSVNQVGEWLSVRPRLNWTVPRPLPRECPLSATSLQQRRGVHVVTDVSPPDPGDPIEIASAPTAPEVEEELSAIRAACSRQELANGRSKAVCE